MSHTTIIWETMSVVVPNDHPVIYQYVKGKARSKESAVGRLTGMMAPIFIGAYDVTKIRGVARQYLHQKELDYIAGKIKIKPIHKSSWASR